MQINVSTFRTILWSGIAGLTVAGSVHAAPMAAITAANPGSANQIADNFTGSIGFQFTVTNAVTVNALGFYDTFNLPVPPNTYFQGSNPNESTGDGLVTSHVVSLYLAGNPVPIASTTIPAGTSATLDNGFRYESVAPIALIPGQTYQVSAGITSNDGDFWLYLPSPSESTDFSGYTGGYTFTTNGAYLGNFGTPPYLGPNFQYVVPEPAGCAMLGLSAAGLLRRSRRR